MEVFTRLSLPLGLLLVLWVALAWTVPERLPGFLAPGVPGLDPGYQATYDACEGALKAGRAEEALLAVDEFLLGPGASGPDAQSVWGLRARALQRGATFVESPAERGQLWRLGRVAARRPLAEWVGLGVAGVLFLGAWLSWRASRPVHVETRPAVGPRPYQNLPPPMMD